MSYLGAMYLSISLLTPVPPLADQAGFDRCVAAVNADPDLGGDSDYIHCDVDFDPWFVLYPASSDAYYDLPRVEVEDHADYPAIIPTDYSYHPEANWSR